MFIKKTFDSWGCKFPSIILTDDDLRGRNYPVNFKQRVKPSSYLFDVVQAEWIADNVLFSEYSRHIEFILESRQRMIYFGDDLVKDGGLAKNSDVPFGLFNQKQDIFERPDSQSFVFHDWNRVADYLCQKKVKKLLKAGETTSNFMSLL